MVIRLLEPDAKPKGLPELGMTEAQSKSLVGLANRHQGLILVVGPTGSGKSTTIYCLLSLLDVVRRSLISVEDPVEYRIAHANQQEVNEVAGVTFEALLRSAVRQDPDILYLGEIRDLTTAKAAMDFASSGHLSISTIHSSNATTTVFRLERLGASRAAMAEALIGVVSQKLLRRLCDECKEVRPPTEEELEMLAPFTKDFPEQVAVPVGCPTCHGKGYWGREGMYEILEFDPDVIRLVREDASIGDIREFVRERGDFLISDHAVTKVRDLKFSVEDVYELVLVEDQPRQKPAADVASGAAEAPAAGVEPEAVPAAPSAEAAEEDDSIVQALAGAELEEDTDAVGAEDGAHILLVDDDPRILSLLEVFLKKEGHTVSKAADGIEALMRIGSEEFDLVVSDINMPNLDGLKLLEMLVQKGQTTPVVFVTGEGSEAEVKGLELGAADFIHKPVKREVAMARINRALKLAR
jgi:CheY-like chemotaxis protein